MHKLLLILWFAAGAVALPNERVEAQGVQSLFASEDTVSVGDHFSFVLLVDRPEQSRLLIPDPAAGDSVMGDLELLESPRLTSRSLGGGAVRDSIIFMVTTFALDSAVVPPQTLTLVSEGDTLRATTPGLTIPVRSLVPPDAEEIQDIAPLIDFPRPIWPWLLLAVLVIGLIILFILYRRSRAEPMPASEVEPSPLHPYEEAMVRLDRLDQRPPTTPDDVKPYYVELSDVLRTYIERRTGIPAREQTSRELLRVMERRQLDGIPSTAVARVRTILEEADLVKFADRRPLEWQARETTVSTRKTIEEMEAAERSKEEQAARTESVEADAK